MGAILAVGFVLLAGLSQAFEVLRTSHDREAVGAAAVRVAKNGSAAAIGHLAAMLASEDFLRRLDDVDAPQLATVHVRQVFSILAEHPSAATEKLCLRVALSEPFMADEARVLAMLRALAAVRPMSAAGEAAFRKQNAEGYAASNAVWLAANGSPRAVGLLEATLADGSMSIADRIDIVRHAIVPYRVRRSVIELAERLVERSVDPTLVVALAESLYDYRPDEWYGKQRNPPKAPDWKTAKPEAARAAVLLGRRLLSRTDLPVRLQKSIRTFVDHMRR
jgi:hypothetical protein